jgi:AAA domain/DnaB-like helicase N terminal domain
MSQKAHDILAEQALLGAAILAHEQTLPAFLAVPENAYYAPKHQVLASVIRDMVVRRQPVDEITILSTLQDAGLIGKVGGAPYLHTLVSRPYMVVNAAVYAERIRELYGRRRLWEVLAREQHLLDADWESGEMSRPIDASVGILRSACDELVQYAAGAAIEPPMTLHEFLAERTAYDWLVPGLLERGDRLILTGEEGFGKSELMGQLALGMAGAVHPFSGDVLDGLELNVLVVDCENGVSQSRRRYRRIAGAVDSTRAMYQAPDLDWSKRLRVEFRPSGLDLLAPSDVAYLEALVAACSPDLLVLGPLYKLHTTNINDGEAARKMLDVLDRVRERHRCALLTEAHASKAESADGKRRMAPEGSSLFMRWPEFGFGLRRDKDDPLAAHVVSWRGQREERDWPGMLHRSSSGLLPWRPGAEYWDRPDEKWSGL